MTLIAIVLATLAAGLGSVWVAAVLMRTGIGSQGSRFGAQHLLSLAAGALLATAFVHLLPEAFESHINPRPLVTADRRQRALLWRRHPDCLGLHGRYVAGHCGSDIGAGP